MSRDPVLERRRRIARVVRLGQRTGYGAFAAAIVAFLYGLIAGFSAVAGPIVGLLVVGSIILAPSIIFGYAVRAAERDDRDAGRPTMDDEESAE